MGKIRVKTFGDEELERLEKQEQEKRKEAKKAEKKLSETKSPKGAEEPQEEVVEEKEEASEASETKSPEGTAEGEPQEEAQKEEKKEKKTQKKEKSDSGKNVPHSLKYQTLSDSFDKTKIYSLSEGLDILEKLQRKVFDETVELHINTVSAGISGSVTLPNGTGKTTKVAIADDGLIAEIEKGKINFDILLAEPSMMPKLARVAKVLGPRGLMPNPKNGTITQKPQEAAKKYEGGQINFKTEAKNPILHLSVGKMSFGKTKLTDNIEEMIKAVKKSNIINITLKSTMSPGIKVKI